MKKFILVIKDKTTKKISETQIATKYSKEELQRIKDDFLKNNIDKDVEIIKINEEKKDEIILFLNEKVNNLEIAIDRLKLSDNEFGEIKEAINILEGIIP